MIEKPSNPRVSAILVAAGNGSRMLGVNKQLHPLNGIPVLAHSIQPFLECPCVTQLVLVCRPEEVETVKAIAQSTIGEKLPYVIALGGTTRQESVFAGIQQASNCDYYAIHDGVRPLVTAEEISRCVQLAVETGAATLGVKVKDTIKVVNQQEEIVSTPKREELYAIHTPQVFEATLYQKAMAQALATGTSYTDDCQLVEHLGNTVSVCLGSYENIKITTKEDLFLAQAILTYRKEGL